MSTTKTILLIAPTPPPMHGAAYATQLLLESRFAEEFRVLHLDAKFVDAVSELQQFTPKKAVLLLRYLWQMLRICKREKVDLLILEPAFYPKPFLKDSLFILTAKYLLRKKVIAWFHMNFIAMNYAGQPGLLRRYIDFVLARIDRGVCVGNALIDGLPAAIDRRRAAAIHNGIPPLALDAAIEDTRRNADDIRVMYLSNMGLEKGWHVLLDAAKIVCSAAENVSVHFYGNPMADSPLEAIHSAFESAGYPQRIVYHGAAYGSDKNVALLAADIFCFPSMYPPEAFPLTVLEAMDAGLPIITTDVGAVAEAVDEGQGGFVVPQNAPDVLAESILNLARDAALRQKQGDYNRARFQREFTVNAFAGRWIDFVNSV